MGQQRRVRTVAATRMLSIGHPEEYVLQKHAGVSATPTTPDPSAGTTKLFHAFARLKGPICGTVAAFGSEATVAAVATPEARGMAFDLTLTAAVSFVAALIAFTYGRRLPQYRHAGG